MATKPGYYVNPVFSQQSEFYPQQEPHRSLSPARALSPGRDIRQSPVGAQQIFDNNENVDGPEILDVEDVEEQEFYEEVIVDDNGFIKGKKFVIVAQNNEGKKYIQVPQEERKGARYQSISFQHSPQKPKQASNQNQRYEYIPMQEQDSSKIVKNIVRQDAPRVHRYAVIEPEETETEICTTHDGRYALVPIEDFKKSRYELTSTSPVNKQSVKFKTSHELLQTTPSKQITGSRYEFKTTPSKENVTGSRYEYTTPSKGTNAGSRYEYTTTLSKENMSRYEYCAPSKESNVGSRYEYIQHSPKPASNPYATQKLHEILSTPKKSKIQTNQKIVLSPNAPRRTSPTVSPTVRDPFTTPKTSPQKVTRQPSTRVQQKLNYAIGSKHILPQEKSIRNTAVVAPMCSSPIQSIYGETTYSSKSESWMNLSMKRTASGKALVIAGFMMFLCGALTSGLCFYMISKMGRLYFLDFGTIAGFTCVILGLLGFRSRNVYWLPNRNYISGYLVLSLFSLIDCAGLLVLLIQQPKPGTPLADMTSGGVCAISVLSLLLAATGVVSSYCCKYPPPDNRVEHCSPGLTV